MAIIRKKLPLFDETFYGYSIPLESNTFYLTFLYIGRLNDWIVTISDAEKNKLVEGQKLTPNTPLFFDYRIPNLSGYFYFTPIKDDDPSELEDRMKTPADYFNLYYYYDNGED